MYSVLLSYVYCIILLLKSHSINIFFKPSGLNFIVVIEITKEQRTSVPNNDSSANGTN